jgi:hypothetical protein
MKTLFTPFAFILIGIICIIAYIIGSFAFVISETGMLMSLLANQILDAAEALGNYLHDA